MSETCGGCVYDGVPLDGVDVETVADDSGAETQPEPDSRATGARLGRNQAPTRAGGTGRIVIGGATLASGYLGRPAETAVAFAGGRFRTGDLGRIGADGRLAVLGRVDDVIVTGGEKVAAAAVERVLVAQPGVRAACVVGVPDPRWGQVVAAAVVLGPDCAATHERLRDAVRAALGRAAVPRRLLDLSELPLRGVGKPDRAAVTQMFQLVP